MTNLDFTAFTRTDMRISIVICDAPENTPNEHMNRLIDVDVSGKLVIFTNVKLLSEFMKFQMSDLDFVTIDTDLLVKRMTITGKQCWFDFVCLDNSEEVDRLLNEPMLLNSYVERVDQGTLMGDVKWVKGNDGDVIKRLPCALAYNSDVLRLPSYREYVLKSEAFSQQTI